MTNRPFIRSRPFDVHRWSDYPELNNCLGELVTEIEGTETRTRRRSEKEASGIRDALRVLALDLYVAWKTDPNLQVGIKLRSNEFSKGTRYDALYLNYRPFKAAFDGLKALGYLAVDKKGIYNRTNGKSYTTRIRATEKLISKLTKKAELNHSRIERNPDEETIILHDRKEPGTKIKRRLEYQDTPLTAAMRGNLQRINRALLNCWVDLYLTDDEFRTLGEKLKKDPETGPIDFGARTLHRVFNNRSFDEGGRFYGGWWETVPREYRRYITINGKPTVELDFSGMHARMLYALEGKELPDDPFDAVGFGEEHRELVKKAFYALVNAGDRGVKPMDGFEQKALGVTWDAFQARIMETHQPIRKYFSTGFGLKLQNLDAQIAERVLLHFASIGRPCLPVHDSFIMHHGFKNELEGVMADAFKDIVGYAIPIEVKESQAWENQGPVGMELDDIFEWLNRYKSHEQRVTEWRKNRNN